MKRLMAILTAGLAGLCSAATTQQAVLTLTEDATVDVAAGDILDVAVIRGGVGFVLTKTGGGTLRVRSCENPAAIIDLKEGRFEMAEPATNAVLADAFFHVDASALRQAADETVVDGTNFVKVLRDVRAGASVYATAKSAAKPPFISPDVTQNGLPLLDFGTFYYNNGEIHDGYGAAMDWSATVNLHHCFIVAGDREEIPGLTGLSAATGPQYIGDGSYYPLMRGRYKEMSAGETLPVFANFSPCLGWNSPCRVDGTDYPAGAKVSLTLGQHLIDVKMTQGTSLGDRVGNFGSERNLARGGFRLGEAVVFGRDLTDYERETVQAYLSKKWFGRKDAIAQLRVSDGATYDLGTSGVTPEILTSAITRQAVIDLTDDQTVDVAAGKILDVAVLKGGAHTLTKTGAGTLRIRSSVNALAKIDLQAGRFEMAEPNAASLLATSFFHVDACEVEKVEGVEKVGDVVSENGTNFVKVLRDVRTGASVYARAKNAAKPPFISPDVTQNGLPLLDFGSFYYNNSGETYDGYGAAMDWSATMNLRHCFIVAGDREEIPGLTGLSNATGPQYIGDGSYYPLMRGKYKEMSTGETLPVFANFSPCLGWNSPCRVDGTDYSAGVKVPLTLGQHLIDVKLTQGTSLSDQVGNFGSERNLARGGFRLGEAVVFGHALDDYDRESIQAYLTKKWFGRQNVLAKLFVSAGATYDLGDSGADPEIRLSNHVRQGKIVLSSDQTVDVPAGQVLEVAVLAGADHTLTKTGEGTLVVYSCDNPTAVVDVRAGRFEMKKPASKYLMSDAFLHMDACEVEKIEGVQKVGDVVSVNGTNFVKVLRDVRAGVSVSATSKNGSNHPFISPDVTQNGLPLLDFGTYWNSGAGLTDGYGAWMKWSADATPRHIFVIAGDREEVPGLDVKAGESGPAFVGYDNNKYTLLRGSWGQSVLSAGATLPLFKNFNLSLGWNSPGRVDGVDYAAQTVVSLKLGQHLIDMQLADRTDIPNQVNNFGTDRKINTGGFRLGEAVVFERVLDAFEREAIQAHLLSKWFGRTDQLAVLRLAAGTTYDLGDSGATPDIITDGTYVRNVDGEKRLTAEACGLSAGVVSFDIRAGRLAISPLFGKGTWLHVDAAETNTMTFAELDGKATVTEWRDVTGNGRYCTALDALWSGLLNHAPAVEKRRPYLHENYANGLPVVDCRAVVSQSIATPEEGGGALKWSEKCLDIREALMVVMDTEDVKGYGARVSAATPFLGGPGGDYDAQGYSYRSYIRDKNAAGAAYPPPIAFDHVSNKWRDSDAWVDGEAVSDIMNDPYPDGLHVLDIRTTTNRYARAFAVDTDNSAGGQRIGEALVFTNVLTDAERADLTAALRWKWFADGALAATRSLTDVTVAEGAGLDFTEKLGISGTLTLAGLLKAPAVKPARLDLTSGTGSLVGTLDLMTPGEILIPTPTAAQLEAGAWRVLPCSAVSAIAKGWTITCAGAPELKLAARADGLYAKVATGLAIIVR